MIIITGGAGFIGANLVEELNRRGQDNILIVDHLGESEKWKNLVGLKYADYLDKTEFRTRLLDGYWGNDVSAVFHLGACSSTTERNMDYLMENNYRYTIDLAEWAVRHEVRFIYASSAATYGEGEMGFSDDDESTMQLRPLNGYAYSKHLFDLYAMRSELLKKIVGLKFFNVFGPKENHKGSMTSVVTQAIEQIKTTGAQRLFKSYRDDYAHGEQNRDFIYVKDCVRVMLDLMDRVDVNGLYNLGTGKARTWNDLARAVFSALNIPENIIYIDMPDHLQGKYQYHTQANMNKLSSQHINTNFPTLEESVRDYVVL